jgi:drug/metabolite transporter (DMT)-like permease
MAHSDDDEKMNKYETDGLRSRSVRFIAKQRRAVNSLLGGGPRENKAGGGLLEIASVGTYVICSSCMLVVNKAAMTALPYSLWVSAMQTAATAILILGARTAGRIAFPNPTPAKAMSWMGILFAWMVPILLNMTAMKLLSVETMMMFRSVATVAVAAADFTFLGNRLSTLKARPQTPTRSPRPTPSREIGTTMSQFKWRLSVQVVACIIISFGGVIYASNDRSYNAEGYLWGAAYGTAMVFNNVYIKYSFNQHPNMNAWEKTFLNNLLATPLIVAAAAWREDSAQLFTSAPPPIWPLFRAQEQVKSEVYGLACVP